jgi:hypothetical protein
MKAMQVATSVTALTLFLPGWHQDASDVPPEQHIVRQQDVGLMDPILAVAGNWTAPPSGRAAAGRVYYSVEVMVPTQDGPPATIGFGLLDEAGKPGPVIASLCDHCFDAMRGAPPPNGWQLYGNHGSLEGTSRFMLNFDDQNGRWAWYLNGQVVRLVESRLFGPGLRVSVGVRLSAANERAHEMWHNDVRVRRNVAGGQIFEPNDGLWPQVMIDGGSASYEPGGTVIVHDADDRPVSQPSTVLPGGRVRGGWGGPIAAGPRMGQVLAARGTAIELIDLQPPRLTTLRRLTSTITALSPIPGGILVGTHAGSLVRLDGSGNTDATVHVNLASPISAIAVDTNDVLVGTETGEVFHFGLSPKWTMLASTHLDGHPRFFVRQQEAWIAGVEAIGASGAAGQVHELRLDDANRIIIQDGIDLTSPPVGIVTPKSGELLVALQSGELRRLTSVSGALVDDGRVLIVPDVITSISGGPTRTYALGRPGDLWTIALEPNEQAHVLTQQSIGMPGGEIGLFGNWLVATSEAGKVAAFGEANGANETPVIESVDVGSVTSLASTGTRLGVLAGYSTLEWLAAKDYASATTAAILLPRRGVAIRPWSDGIAVVNGDAGLDIYREASTEPISHLETPGVCRDLVASDQGLAYIACGAKGVYVADLTDISQPKTVAVVETDHPALSLAVHAQTLLVGQQAQDILAFDLSEPRAPRLIGRVENTPNVGRIVVHRGAALGLSRTGTVFQLDISDTSMTSIPKLVATVRYSRYGYDITADDTGILVASAGDGLRIAAWPNGEVFTTDSSIFGPVTTVSGTYDHPLVGTGPAGLTWWATITPTPAATIQLATPTATPETVYRIHFPILDSEG